MKILFLLSLHAVCPPLVSIQSSPLTLKDVQAAFQLSKRAPWPRACMSATGSSCEARCRPSSHGCREHGATWPRQLGRCYSSLQVQISTQSTPLHSHAKKTNTFTWAASRPSVESGIAGTSKELLRNDCLCIWIPSST